MPRRDNAKDKRAPGNSRIQGEGDYISGHRYQKDAEEFARTHDTNKLAREAAPATDAEQREMNEAERKGKARAKGKKPAPR
jgi:hypothetical protein